MFTENDLRELLEWHAPDSVLSIYLNTDPSLGNTDAYSLRLRNMLKEVNLPDDLAAVEKYMNTEYDWSGRGIAIFSCAANNNFRAYPLAIPVHDMVQVGDYPGIQPLANQLETYGGYGVVVIDKQGARLFSFHLGELKEQEGVLGDTVKRMKRGTASGLAGRRGGTEQARAMDETIDRNMREAAEFAARFFEENNIRRILIGGTDDNIAALRSQLPKAWQSLIVGTFASSMLASHNEVFSKALELGREADKKRIKSLVNTLTSAAAKGQGAVIGLEETLAAVSEGRVKTLVMVDNLHLPGYICRDCGILTTQPEETCRGCSNPPEAIRDVVEAAVTATLRSGGGVEVILEEINLPGDGHIGALLRY